MPLVLLTPCAGMKDVLEKSLSVAAKGFCLRYDTPPKMFQPWSARLPTPPVMPTDWVEALDIVAETAGNETVSIALRETQSAVKRGDTLARPLEQHEVFPMMVTQMIAVGEETGALDEMLDKIADFYDQEVTATVDALTSLIEPLMIVVMGTIVGGMIISLYLPMFNIIKLIK